ncbi:hypothetical protein ES705_49198 [subsurface metagenome]
MEEIKVAICRDCKWWEFLEEDPPVGDHGACHHPIAEAQYIAHMGEPAPNGLAMEGAIPGHAGQSIGKPLVFLDPADEYASLDLLCV